MLGPMLSKARNFPRATAIPRTEGRRGRGGAIGQGGWLRRLKAARSWRPLRSGRELMISSCVLRSESAIRTVGGLLKLIVPFHISFRLSPRPNRRGFSFLRTLRHTLAAFDP